MIVLLSIPECLFSTNVAETFPEVFVCTPRCQAKSHPRQSSSRVRSKSNPWSNQSSSCVQRPPFESSRPSVRTQPWNSCVSRDRRSLQRVASGHLQLCCRDTAAVFNSRARARRGEARRGAARQDRCCERQERLASARRLHRLSEKNQ